MRRTGEEEKRPGNDKCSGMRQLKRFGSWAVLGELVAGRWWECASPGDFDLTPPKFRMETGQG